MKTNFSVCFKIVKIIGVCALIKKKNDDEANFFGGIIHTCLFNLNKHFHTVEQTVYIIVN